MPENHEDPQNSRKQLLSSVYNDVTLGMWRTFILGGMYSLVEASIKSGDVTADTPIDDSGRHPLVDCVLIDPAGGEEKTNQLKVIDVLLRNNPTLWLPDYKNLRPADHALTGASEDAAVTIVLATIKDTYRRGAMPYKPNIRAIFATTVGVQQSYETYNRVCRNIDAVKKAVDSSFTQDDINFWAWYDVPALDDLPESSDELELAFQEVARLEGVRHSFESGSRQTLDSAIEEACDRMRYLEWKCAQPYKPA